MRRHVFSVARWMLVALLATAGIGSTVGWIDSTWHPDAGYRRFITCWLGGQLHIAVRNGEVTFLRPPSASLSARPSEPPPPFIRDPDEYWSKAPLYVEDSAPADPDTASPAPAPVSVLGYSNLGEAVAFMRNDDPRWELLEVLEGVAESPDVHWKITWTSRWGRASYPLDDHYHHAADLGLHGPAYEKARIISALLTALDDPNRFVAAHLLLRHWAGGHPNEVITDFNPRQREIDVDGLLIIFDLTKPGNKLDIESEYRIQPRINYAQLDQIREQWHRRLDQPSFRLPCWLLSPLLLAGPAGISFATMRRAMVRLRRHRLGRCTSCGYDLRASDHLCPECGRRAAGRDGMGGITN